MVVGIQFPESAALVSLAFIHLMHPETQLIGGKYRMLVAGGAENPFADCWRRLTASKVSTVK